MNGAFWIENVPEILRFFPKGRAGGDGRLGSGLEIASKPGPGASQWGLASLGPPYLGQELGGFAAHLWPALAAEVDLVILQGEDGGLILGEMLFANEEGSSNEVDGILNSAESLKTFGKIRHGNKRSGMCVAEDLQPPGKDLLVNVGGSLKVSNLDIGVSQVVHRVEGVNIVGPHFSLSVLNDIEEDLNGFIHPVGSKVDQRESVLGHACLDVVRAQVGFAALDAFQRQW